LAEILGRPPRLVSELIAGKRAITPETAKGLGEAFNTGAQFWMNLESSYRLAQVKQDRSNSVSRAAWASRWWRMALKAWAVGMVSNSLKAWSKNHWRKERERMAKVRKPEDGAGTVMKARPSTPVKGTPHSRNTT